MGRTVVRDIARTVPRTEDFARSEKPTTSGKRRRIEFFRGRQAEATDEAEKALIDARANVYVRGTMLVLVVSKTTAGDIRDAAQSSSGPLIVPHTATSLADCINRVALFHRFDQRDHDWKPIDCPRDVAETLLCRVGSWRLPPLKAVINCPTLRPDGTVLGKAGYDGDTGLLLVGNTHWPPIIEKPTQTDAAEALVHLNALLDQFPFVDEVDRAAAVAMLLTAVVRPSLPTAPLFGITAPTPGTGKSYLADLASALATGSKAAVVAADCDEEELDKRIGASLMAGDRVLNLDNISHALRSSFLCQVLSQETVKHRILGRSINLDTPTIALMIATGNALRVHGDLNRRVLLIRLDTGAERPELRAFNSDPLTAAIANRPKYVAAALTILRAYITSEKTVKVSPLGSFEGWSTWVREAIVWLGLPDPLGAMEAARGTDPERARTAEILAALISEGEWTAKDLARRLTPDATNNLNLRDALSGFSKYGQFDSHAFGNWCSKHRDRPVEGMTLVEAGVDGKAKVKRWRVKNPQDQYVSVFRKKN